MTVRSLNASFLKGRVDIDLMKIGCLNSHEKINMVMPSQLLNKGGGKIFQCRFPRGGISKSEDDPSSEGNSAQMTHVPSSRYRPHHSVPFAASCSLSLSDQKAPKYRPQVRNSTGSSTHYPGGLLAKRLLRLAQPPHPTKRMSCATAVSNQAVDATRSLVGFQPIGFLWWEVGPDDSRGSQWIMRVDKKRIPLPGDMMVDDADRSGPSISNSLSEAHHACAQRITSERDPLSPFKAVEGFIPVE